MAVSHTLTHTSVNSTQSSNAAASVADRLRKQIKNHAVKVLRETIAEKSCGVTTAMLRGHSGPMAVHLCCKVTICSLFRSLS
jgi:hypothetical protein